jgi:hypothetical protein
MLGLLLSIAVKADSSLGDLAPIERLDKLAGEIAAQTLAQFGAQGLKSDQLAITIVEIDQTAKTQAMGHYRGDEPLYPASVVKLFYFAYAHKLMQDKKLKLTPEFDRALADMIKESSNDATGLVLETVTDTTGGPELPPAQLKTWMHKRNAVNRWFTSIGYSRINVNQKTWCEGPYGRERQGYGPNFEFRNSLTANMTARLMTEIATRKMVNEARSGEMLKTLKRSLPAEAQDADYQSRAFTGKSLPKGSELYSKAGYTDSVRHDVAYVKLPNGKELVIAIFTKANSNRTEIIPFAADAIVRRYLGQ